MGSRNLSQLQSGQSIHIRFFADDAAVYSEVSAETHLLTLPAARVLEAILAGDARMSDLERVLAAAGGNPDEENIEQQVHHCIAEFQKLGLVRWAGELDS